MNERRTPVHNIGFALWGLTCFYETFVQGSTFVLRMTSGAKNPTQRKAENRTLVPIIDGLTQSLKTLKSRTQTRICPLYVATIAIAFLYHFLHFTNHNTSFIQIYCGSKFLRILEL